MKMYLCAQSELFELHQCFKSANPTAGAEAWIGTKKSKRINLSLQSDTQWKSCRTNDSFISALQQRWTRQMIGVQTGSSGPRFSYSSMDKCHRQHLGRCWGAWRCFFGKSDSIWQCVFSPPHHPSRLYPFSPNILPEHPSIPLNQQCLLWVPTCHFFFNGFTPRGAMSVIVISLSLSLSLWERFVVLRLILHSSETQCAIYAHSAEASWLQLWSWCTD